MGNQTNRQSRNQKQRIAASRRSSLQQSASVSSVGNTNSSTADLAIDTAAKAMMLAQAGQLEPARLLCCQALENDPDNAQAWHVLGMTMHLAGEAKLAIDSLQKSADLATPDAALLCNLGVAHAELGQQSEAVANYRHALKLQPNQPETHNNLANALQALGQLSEAADHYRCAVELRPSYTDATTNLGTVLERLGDLAGASAMYLKTLETNPADVTALNNLGSVLSRQEQNAEAIECLKLALELKPDSAAAYSNLAFVFAKQGNHSDVLDLLRTAMELDPAYASNYLFMLSKDPTASRQEIFAQHQRWGQAVEQSIAAFVHDRGTDPYRKLRIGYVSPDLREHVVAKYIEPILQHHDGEQIETFCYAEVFSPDAATDRMKQLATHCAVDLWTNIRECC